MVRIRELLKLLQGLRAHPGASARRLVPALKGLAYVFRTDGWAFPPETIFLNLNARCNARCRMCDVGARRRDSVFYRNMVGAGEADMPLPLFRKLVGEVASFRPKMLFNGVEPLMYGPLAEATRIARAHGLRVEITTNGLLLPRRAQELVEAGVNSFHVSIDGPPEVNDRIRRVPGLTENAIEGIRQVERAARKRGVPSPERNVVCTVSPLNQDRVVEHLDRLASFGALVQRVSLLHLQFVTAEMAARHRRVAEDWLVAGEMSVGLEVDPRRVAPAVLSGQLENVRKREWPFPVAQIPDLAGPEDVRRFYHEHGRYVKGRPCLVPWGAIQFKSDGEAVPLTRCFAVSLGNLRERRFEKIWNGPEMRRLRRALRRYDSFPVCLRCCGVL